MLLVNQLCGTIIDTQACFC